MLVSRQVSRSFSVTLVNGFLGFFVLKTQYEKNRYEYTTERENESEHTDILTELSLSQPKNT